MRKLYKVAALFLVCGLLLSVSAGLAAHFHSAADPGIVGQVPYFGGIALADKTWGNSWRPGVVMTAGSTAPYTVPGLNFRYNIKQGYNYFTDDGWYGWSVTPEEQATLNADVSQVQDSYLDFYWGNDTAPQRMVYLSSYDYFMVDVDFRTNENGMNNSFFVTMSRYINDAGKDSTAANGESHVSLNGFSVELKDGTKYTLKPNEEYHFTVVIEINHEDFSLGRQLVYINGEYFGETTCPFTANSEWIEAFRWQIKKTNPVYSNRAQEFHDFIVHAFPLNYEGTICDLFENPDQDLTDCVDSILYEGVRI